jgi:steroid 5-alpha reductase family enzyme
MVWNSLIISSIPSLFYFYTIESQLIWAGIFVSIIYISRIMYTTLVYYTGVIPSEYYSVLKRPDYKKMQKNTNMFFPGFPKNKFKLKNRL